MKELLRTEMLSVLVEKLKEEPGIYLYRLTEQTLWEKFEDSSAHFVVRNDRIVGCGLVWDDLRRAGEESVYVELGTVWAQERGRASILAELGDNIPRIAKGKKIMGFCSKLKLARYFRKSPLFPVNKIADQKTCPAELIESIPQIRGWSSSELASAHKPYEYVLYREDEEKVTPWYIVYEQ